MKCLLITIPLWLSLTCCSSPLHENTALNNQSVSQQEVQNPQKMSEVITQEGLQALTSDAAINKFGAPATQDTFVIDGRLPEFRIELYNYFKDYKGKNIRIVEMTWSLNSDENITAWYPEGAEQKPVHTLKWAKESEF